MRPHKIGVIVNPKSGLGAAHNLCVAQQAVAALGAESVVTGAGLLGGDALPAARVLSIPALMGRAASQALARAALDSGVDALVVIGGDGTLSDVASTIYQAGMMCPLLGIGAGSINAGDLITCKAAQVDDLRGCDLRVERLNALEAAYNGRVMALAFNDIVIGTTIVGTVDGNYRDLDAKAFMDGRQERIQPRPVGREGARVVRRGSSGEVLVSSGQAVGTVVVGFSQYECFFGKAISGGVCLSSVAGAPAGCIVSDHPLVVTRLDLDVQMRTEPVHSAYVSLTGDDVIEVTGLDDPAVLCADGNPLAALRPADECQMRVRPGAVDVLRTDDK